MMRVGRAFGWHMPEFVLFAESTLEVRVGRTVAGRMPWSVLVICPTAVLGTVDLPVTRHLAVETDSIAGGAVGSVVHLPETILEDRFAWVGIWFSCSYGCWSGCECADRWLGLHRGIRGGWYSEYGSVTLLFIRSSRLLLQNTVPCLLSFPNPVRHCC